MPLFRILRNIRDDIQTIKHEVEKALRLRVVFIIGDQVTRRIRMKDTQSQVASLEFDDAAGFATTAVPDAPPAWTSDDNGAFVSLTPSADGLSCVIAAKAPGNANVSVALSIGGTQFAGSVPVAVVGGNAVSIKINLAAPTP